jgi:hypothetical protein
LLVLLFWLRIGDDFPVLLFIQEKGLLSVGGMLAVATVESLLYFIAYTRTQQMCVYIISAYSFVMHWIKFIFNLQKDKA